MKTTILLLASFSEFNELMGLKEEICSYLGQRMVLERMDGFPALVIRDTLDNEDKGYISNLVEKLNSPSIGILYVEGEATFTNNISTTVKL